VIQEGTLFVVAVQLQPLEAVTFTVPDSAPEPCDRLVGVMLYVQTVPACVTVNVRPAMVSVPVRELAPVFAATEYVTVPFPLPLAPEAILIQETLLAAAQLHPLDAVTVTLPDSASEPWDRFVGKIM
jgi:hypothetical protein